MSGLVGLQKLRRYVKGNLGDYLSKDHRQNIIAIEDSFEAAKDRVDGYFADYVNLIGGSINNNYIIVNYKDRVSDITNLVNPGLNFGFTLPFDSVLEIHCCILLVSVPGTADSRLSVFLNNVEYRMVARNINHSGSALDLELHGSCKLYLQKNDVLTIKAYCSGSTSLYTGSDQFLYNWIAIHGRKMRDVA